MPLAPGRASPIEETYRVLVLLTWVAGTRAAASDESFAAKLSALDAFVAAHGHAGVPRDHPELGRWLAGARRDVLQDEEPSSLIGRLQAWAERRERRLSGQILCEVLVIFQYLWPSTARPLREFISVRCMTIGQVSLSL